MSIRALKTALEEKSALKKANQKSQAADALSKFSEEYDAKISMLQQQEGEISRELSTLRSQLLSEESVKNALVNFHTTFQLLPMKNRVDLCQLFFKRITARYLTPGEVASASGGYAMSDGTVVFPVKRTKWVELKFEVRANVDYQRLFNKDLKVRIGEKLAFPGASS